MLEELDRPLVLLRRRARGECPQVLPPARLLTGGASINVRRLSPLRKVAVSESISSVRFCVGLGVLHMGWIIWIVGVPLALYVVICEFLDVIGRLEIIEKRWPKVHSAMSNRPMRLVLIILVLGLIGKDVIDRLQMKVPALYVTIKPPIVPEVVFVSPGTVPKTTSQVGNYPAYVIPPPIEHLTLLQEATNSTHDAFPFATKITIQSTISENPIYLNVWFKSPVRFAQDLSHFENGDIWQGGIEIASDPRCVVVSFKSVGNAMLRSDRPVIFRLESDQPIQFQKWLRKTDTTWHEVPKPQ